MNSPKNLKDLQDFLPSGGLKDAVMNYNFNKSKIPDVYKLIVDDEFDQYLNSGDTTELEKAIRFALKKIGIEMQSTDVITGNKREISNLLNITGSGKKVFQDVGDDNDISIGSVIIKKKSENISGNELQILGMNQSKTVELVEDGIVNISGMNNTLKIERLNGTLSGTISGMNNTIKIKSAGPNAKINVTKSGANNDIKIKDQLGGSIKSEIENKEEKNIKRESKKRMEVNGKIVDLNLPIEGTKLGSKPLGELGDVDVYRDNNGDIVISFTIDGKESRVLFGDMAIGFINGNQMMQGGTNSSSGYMVLDKKLLLKSSPDYINLGYGNDFVMIDKKKSEVSNF